MEGEAATLDRLLRATARWSPIDREAHAGSILRELDRARRTTPRLDEHLLDRARAHVPEQEDDS